MKLELKSSKALIPGLLGVVALAIAFWMLAIGPKRDESSKLGEEAKALRASLAGHRAEISEGVEARSDFSADYQKLVVLGKAVPGDDDTASLLVQINRISDSAGVRFDQLELEPGSGGEATGEASSTASAEGAQVSATEAAASLLPLGATIGPAGLGVMPYTLTFQGSFFKIADFIKGLDSLVKTSKRQVAVDGRLLTLDGFSLEGDAKEGFPRLEATFAVTAYLTPPGEGITGGAGPESPEGAEAAPVAATIGAAR